MWQTMWQKFFKVMLWIGGIVIGLGVLGALIGGPAPVPASADTASQKTAEPSPPPAPVAADASSQKAAEPPPPPASPLEKIKALDSDITEVLEPVAGTLTIRHSPAGMWNGSTWVRSFLFDVLRILSKMDEAAPGHSYHTVHFFAELPTVDNLGREGKSVGMEVTYKLEDFKGAVWGNMSHWNMADLASDVDFRRLGLESAADFCGDEQNVQYSPRFCARVLARLIQ